MKKIIKRVGNSIRKNWIYYNVLHKSKNHKKKERVVFLDITHIRKDRYLANLITFFKINDFTI